MKKDNRLPWDDGEYDIPAEENFKPILWEDLKQKNFPEAKWRINNLIPMEGLVFLASVSGEGKSWIAMEMANSIVQEKDFLGNPEFKTIGGNVLYVNGEMAESELQRRGKQLNLKSSKFKLHFLTHDLNFKEIKADGEDDLEELDLHIKKLDISVVIIDTFRSVAGGLKEEKAEEVRLFLDKFKKYKNSGITVVFLEHNRKPAHFETKIPQKEHLFGSQDKVSSVEVLLMIKTDENSRLIHVYQRKNRLGLPVKPFKISMVDVFEDQGETYTNLKYEGEVEDSDTKKEEAMEKIVVLLEQGPMTTKSIIAVMNREHKIGQKNTRSALREIRSLGLINSVKQGREDLYSLPTEAQNSDSDKKEMQN